MSNTGNLVDMKKPFSGCGSSCRRLYWLMEVCENQMASKGSFNSKLGSNCLKFGVVVVVLVLVMMYMCISVQNCRALYISPKDDSIIFTFLYLLIDWQQHTRIEHIVIIFSSLHSVFSPTVNDFLFPVRSPLSPLFMQASLIQTAISAVCSLLQKPCHMQRTVFPALLHPLSLLVFLPFCDALWAWEWVIEIYCLGQNTQSHLFSTHWTVVHFCINSAETNFSDLDCE